jgi:pre-mRNA-processing factor 19
MGLPKLIITQDAVMLETYTLKKQFNETRQQLSNALYENDAAKRVIARLIKERDEARIKLSEFKGSYSTGDSKVAKVPEEATEEEEDVDMSIPLPEAVVDRIDQKSEELSSLRKKRKVAESLASPEEIAALTVCC